MAKRKKKKRRVRNVPGRVMSVTAGCFAVLALLVRIFLHESLTVSGQGYFAVAIQWFLVFAILGGGGLFRAVSRMVSLRVKKGSVKNAKKVVTVAMAVSVIAGLLLAVATFAASSFLCDGLSGAQLARPALMCMSVSVLPLCMAAVLMGGLDGLGVSDAAQVPGLAGCISFLIAAVLCSSRCRAYGDQVGALLQNPQMGPAYAALGAAAGMAIGSWVGFLTAVLAWIYKKRTIHALAVNESGYGSESRRNMLRGIFHTRMSGLLVLWLPACFLAIQNVLYSRLQEENYITDWGSYMGMTVTILTVAIFVTMGFAVRQIPGLRIGFEQRNLKKSRTKLLVTMRAMAVFLIPAALFTLILSRSLVNMFFGEDNLYVQKMLIPGGIGLIFMGIASILCCVLWSMKKEKLVILGICVSGILMLLSETALFGVLNMKILAVMWADLLWAVYLCVFCYIAVTRAEKIRISWLRVFLAPLLGGVVSGVVCWFLSFFLSQSLGAPEVCMISIMVSAVIYFFVEVSLQGVDQRILMEYPGGEKIYDILRTFRLM